ncbi:MAG: hypothetical protein WDN04_00675 [Rhodospirillales bacterium]
MGGVALGLPKVADVGQRVGEAGGGEHGEAGGARGKRRHQQQYCQNETRHLPPRSARERDG